MTVTPFRICVPDEVLNDLRIRPDPDPVHRGV